MTSQHWLLSPTGFCIVCSLINIIKHHTQIWLWPPINHWEYSCCPDIFTVAGSLQAWSHPCCGMLWAFRSPWSSEFFYCLEFYFTGLVTNLMDSILARYCTKQDGHGIQWIMNLHLWILIPLIKNKSKGIHALPQIPPVFFV